MNFGSPPLHQHGSTSERRQAPEQAAWGTTVDAEVPQVTHVKHLLHLCLEGLHLLLFRAGDDQVVDVDADEQDKVSAALPVHRRLMRALLEAHLLECGVELRVPGAR